MDGWMDEERERRRKHCHSQVFGMPGQCVALLLASIDLPLSKLLLPFLPLHRHRCMMFCKRQHTTDVALSKNSLHCVRALMLLLLALLLPVIDCCKSSHFFLFFFTSFTYILTCYCCCYHCRSRSETLSLATADWLPRKVKAVANQSFKKTQKTAHTHSLAFLKETVHTFFRIDSVRTKYTATLLLMMLHHHRLHYTDCSTRKRREQFLFLNRVGYWLKEEDRQTDDDKPRVEQTTRALCVQDRRSEQTPTTLRFVDVDSALFLSHRQRKRCWRRKKAYSWCPERQRRGKVMRSFDKSSTRHLLELTLKCDTWVPVTVAYFRRKLAKKTFFFRQTVSFFFASAKVGRNLNDNSMGA